MKRTLLGTVLIGMMATGLVLAQEGTNKPKAPPAAGEKPKAAAPGGQKPEGTMSPEMQKQMEQMMAMGMPGPAHEKLKPFAGTFKVTCKSYFAPGSEPEVTEGACTSEWIMGGRFLKSKHTGQMMGMPFEGMGMLGYDNTMKKYVNTWQDSMCTGIAIAYGDVDASGKVFTYTMDFIDPMTGKPAKSKNVAKIIDDNTNTFAMYMIGEKGEEILQMEMTSTRTK